MSNDPVDCLRLIDKRDDSHLAAAGGTKQGIPFIHFADHLGPALGRYVRRVIFYNKRIKRISPGLSHLAPMGIGIKAVVADYVFADSFCLGLGLGPDLAVDIETRVAPVEDLLHQGKADELFPEKQGEDLVGEDFLDNLVMEARDMVKNCVIKVDRRLIIGSKQKMKQLLFASEDSSTINTSFIERLNLTIRQGCAYLGRRTACHSRHKDLLDDNLALQMCHSNFVKSH